MSEDNEKKPDAKIRIEVDSKGSDRLASILEKEREEKQQKEQAAKEAEKQKTEPNLADLKIQAYEKFGHNENFLHAETKGELSQMITNFIDELSRKAKGAPSGTAPANAQQYGIKDDLYTHKFSSWGELIDTLTEKAKTSHEAKSYLDEYWRMAVQAMKSNQTPIPIPNRNDPQNMPPLKDEHGYKVLVNPERDSDIQSLQKKWREERMKRMGIKTEEGESQ